MLLRNEAATQARLQELPRHATVPQRAEPGRSAQAVRRARRADARAVRAGQGRDRRQARRPTTASPSTSCGRGTTTIRSSRRRPPSSAPTWTRRLPEGRHPRSCAASSTPASACRSTTCSQRSDLYEKPGKSPHAFCTDIDREGDVRVLANIVPNEYWMGTMLHELGHSVYSQQEHPATACPTCCAPRRTS